MNKSIRSLIGESAYAVLERCDTPEKVQSYIDTHIIYDPYREDRSVLQVIEDGFGECYNGALFGVACLLVAGYKASIIELYARGGDEEHILAVYKQGKYYGCVAQSKYLGLKTRQPIYSSIRDLAVSYMEYYFGYDGRYSLQSYTSLFPLGKYQGKWLTDSATVEQIGKDLRNATHHKLTNADDPYYYVSPERYWKEILYIPPNTTIPEQYLKAKPSYVDLKQLSKVSHTKKLKP